MTFNILKELCLNDSNKDILHSVLEYVERITRYRIVVSFNNYITTLCDNCFRQRYTFTLPCTSFGHTQLRHFCADCTKEHHEKYTNNSIIRGCYPYRWKNGIVVQFDHICEFNEGFIIGDIPLRVCEKKKWKILKNATQLYFDHVRFFRDGFEEVTKEINF